MPTRRSGGTGGFDEAISRESGGWSPGCTAAFFGVFLVAGLGLLALLGWPVVQTFEARSSWIEVPCEILASDVGSHSDSDGTTYSVDVRYRYSVDGRAYESDRYRFLGGSSSGYEGKQRVVDALPPGTVTPCRYDPEDPAEAVLDVRFGWWTLLALFPLPFLLVGAGGVFHVARKSLQRRRDDRPASIEPGEAAGSFSFASSPDGAAEDGEPVGDGPMVLEPTWSPVGKLVGIVLVALFWNGITGVFVWQVWKSWSAGAPDGCLTIFLIPFVLVGLLLLAGVPYQFLALFNPRPRLELIPGRVVLGGSNELRWSFRGNAGRIRRLKIALEGTEAATYRQGTDTRTDTETFATLEMVNESQAVGIPQGAAAITIPADTMHSFRAPSNRIVWKLKLHGEIARWPDVNEELEIDVHPLSLDDLEERP